MRYRRNGQYAMALTEHERLLKRSNKIVAFFKDLYPEATFSDRSVDINDMWLHVFINRIPSSGLTKRKTLNLILANDASITPWNDNSIDVVFNFKPLPDHIKQ